MIKNSIIDIRARRSGKTTYIVNEFLKAENFYGSKNVFLLAFNSQHKKMLEQKIKEVGGGYHKNILTVNQFSSLFRGYRKFNENVIAYIDEYFMLSNKDKQILYELENIVKVFYHAIGTADMLYDKGLIELSKLIKQYPDIYNMLTSEFREEIKEKYFYNFLTDSSFEIKNDRICEFLPDEKIRTDILGEYLKG